MAQATNPKIDELRSRMQADPKSRLFYQLAEELRRAGEYAEAERVLRTGLEVYPAYLAAWVSLGRVLREQKKDAEAVDALNRALQLDPSNVVAARLLADAWMELGESAEALDKYRLVHALLPADEALRVTIDRLEREVGSRRTPPPPAPEPPPVAAAPEEAAAGALFDAPAAEEASGEVGFALDETADDSGRAGDLDLFGEMREEEPSPFGATAADSEIAGEQSSAFDDSATLFETSEAGYERADEPQADSSPPPAGDLLEVEPTWSARANDDDRGDLGVVPVPPSESRDVLFGGEGPFTDVDRVAAEASQVFEETGDAEPMHAAHEESPFEEPVSGFTAAAVEIESPPGISIEPMPMSADVAAPIDSEPEAVHVSVTESVSVETPLGEDEPLLARDPAVAGRSHGDGADTTSERAVEQRASPTRNAARVERLERWLSKVGKREVPDV